MKKAQLIARRFQVRCPYCRAYVKNKTYHSFDWDIRRFYAGTTHTCQDCNNEFLLPSIVQNSELRTEATT